jgi:hypothetical protein
MDQHTLVRERIDDGKRVADGLPGHGFEVAAALWIQAVDDEEWRFYIISPDVEKDGLTAAYGKLHTAIRKMQPTWIDPLEVRLLGPSDPIAQDVLAVYRRLPPPRAAGTWWSGKHLGGMSIEGAYLYPLPANAPA